MWEINGIKNIKQKLEVKNIQKFNKTCSDLCGCEAWTLTNRDEQHLKIFELRILRKSLAQCKMKMDPGESE
jgi:hypothetical protein